jgi:hypothetical protein
LADSSARHPVQVYLEYTTDPIGEGAKLSGDSGEWVIADERGVPQRKGGVEMTANLPPGTTAVRLSTDSFDCSSTLVWADPTVS